MPIVVLPLGKIRVEARRLDCAAFFGLSRRDPSFGDSATAGSSLRRPGVLRSRNSEHKASKRSNCPVSAGVDCPCRWNVLAKHACPVGIVAIGRYIGRMRSVSIKVLNSKLSEYVRLASSGERILVTDRDRVVAELGPLKETRSPNLADAFLADAVRSGVLVPARLVASGPPPKPAPVATLNEILADLDESRRDR